MIKKILNLFRKKNKDDGEEVIILLDKLFCAMSKCKFRYSVINSIPATLAEPNTTIASLKKRLDKLYKKSGFYDGSFSNIDYMVRYRTALFTYNSMYGAHVYAREVAIANAMVWIALAKMEDEKTSKTEDV